MDVIPTSQHDPLATKVAAVAEKLNRRRMNARETSIEVNAQRSKFFDRLAVLNAGALTFSVTLLNVSSLNAAIYPPILLFLYAAWACLLIALLACLLRN